MKRSETETINEGQQKKRTKLTTDDEQPRRISTIQLTTQGSIVSNSTHLKISNVNRTLNVTPGTFPQINKPLSKVVTAGISIKTPDQLNQTAPMNPPPLKTNCKQAVYVQKKPLNNSTMAKSFQLPSHMMVKKISPKLKQPPGNPVLPCSPSHENVFNKSPPLRLPARPQANKISLQASPAALSKLTAQINSNAASKAINISMKETTEYIKQLETENQNFKNIISKITVEMEEIRQKFSGWETIIKGVNLCTQYSSVFNNPNVQKIPTLRTPAKRTFKIPKFPISNYEAFHVFEKEMTFQKYYDLVFTSISKILPVQVKQRSLIGFLRRIITDELLSQFVWTIIPEEGLQGRRFELSKFYNFQSLLFSLVNKFNAQNFPNGIKWQELEVFLKHQIKASRERATKRQMQLEPIVMIEEADVKPTTSNFKPGVHEIPEFEEYVQKEKVEEISMRGRKRTTINYVDLEKRGIVKNPIAKKKKLPVRSSTPTVVKKLPEPIISIYLDEEPQNNKIAE